MIQAASFGGLFFCEADAPGFLSSARQVPLFSEPSRLRKTQPCPDVGKISNSLMLRCPRAPSRASSCLESRQKPVFLDFYPDRRTIT
jgi:hypothetical protein